MNSEEHTEQQLEYLKKQLFTFSMANEVSGAISTAPDVKAVYNALAHGLKEILHFPRTILFRIDSSEKFLLPDTQMGFDEDQITSATFSLDFLSGAWFDAIAQKKHIIADSVDEEDSFYALGSRSYAAFPLLSRIRQEVLNPSPEEESDDSVEKTAPISFELKSIGLLWIDLPNGRQITADEVAMLNTIAAQTTHTLESFRMVSRLEESNVQLKTMYDALTEAQRVIQRDLKSANRIQQSLMPSEFPKHFSDIAAHYVPNSSVGGDYYDAFPISDTKAGLLIADVSGHGISAAMIMTMFKILLRDYSLRSDSPSEVLNQVNSTMLRELDTEHFVTCFYAIFDLKNRNLIWTNAGHDPIFLQGKESGIQELHSCGTFVGAFPEMGLSDATETLEESQRILLYTDGIPEAVNSKKEPFGEPRLKNLLAEYRLDSCHDLVKAIIASLDEFTGDEPLKDDITLLIADL